MVAPEIIKASNARLPSQLVGVFVGGTSGVGENTLKSFARHIQQPRAYFVGRSQSAADRITAELQTLNPQGEYFFIKSDVSLVKNVDTVCQEIRAKEKYVNLLFITTGTLVTGTESEEGLHVAAGPLLHTRTRFTLDLLPLLQSAPTLRRVVSVFAGTKEGLIVDPDVQFRKLPAWKVRGQAASTVTLIMEDTARRASNVSFVHSFPGPVKSNIARGGGVTNLLMRSIFKVIGPLMYIPPEESGDRNLWISTTSTFAAKEGGVNGVDQDKGVEMARGTDGQVGSGVYVVDEKGEVGDAQVVELLKDLRKEGKNEYVWKGLKEDLVRITGKESMDA